MEKIISDILKPTLKNTTNFFILTSMNEIICNKQLSNFNIEFRQKEALDFIEKVFQSEVKKFNNKYLSDYEKNLKRKYSDLLKKLKNPNKNNNKKPTMIITDYKRFFSLLTEGYEKITEMYFEDCESRGETWNGKINLPAYVIANYFQYVWQRMKPEDFNKPEDFLEKQNKMLKDDTLNKYNNETYLGELQSLGDNILCIKNSYAESWDECNRQIEISVYDKNYYRQEDILIKPKCVLPLIRYGIYDKGDKKICYVGSIQHKNEGYQDEEYEQKTKINKVINRKKFKINEDVPKENTEKVEPTNILALSVFIDIMNKEGITNFEIPSLYVLDYEYHEKRSKEIYKEFKNQWNDQENQEKNPKAYLEALNYKERNYNKQDLISEIKTERIIKNFERILYHYKNGKIISYPGEADHSFYIRIPRIKNREEINGKLIKEIYDIIEGREKER